jgi:hypothetical protein
MAELMGGVCAMSAKISKAKGSALALPFGGLVATVARPMEDQAMPVRRIDARTLRGWIADGGELALRAASR